MSDPRAELAALVADVRAALEDEGLRGMLAEDPAASLPEPEGVEAAPEEEAAPEPEAPPTTAPSAGAGAARRAWTALASSARREAEERASTGAEGLRRIREEMGDCRRCGLCTGRTRIVFGVGHPEADLVVVGEAPGRFEDLQGEPFVGPAGQMLDKMLQNVLQLARGEVHILDVVKCRPPENRAPEPAEVHACRPFLERQIAAIAPKLMLVLGEVAFQALFLTDEPLARSRGRWRAWNGIPVMPTLHPSHLLQNPQEKREVFADLLAVKARYDELGGRR